MEIASFLSEGSILPSLKASSKKQAFQLLASKAAHITGMPEAMVLETLTARERLGSTGAGHGVAIPHGRFPSLGHIFGVFARLETPIEFDAIDHIPVDLIFLLLVPDSAGAMHLKALAKISRLLKDKSVCEKLRGCTSADAIYVLLTQHQMNDAA